MNLTNIKQVDNLIYKFVHNIHMGQISEELKEKLFVCHICFCGQKKCSDKLKCFSCTSWICRSCGRKADIPNCLRCNNKYDVYWGPYEPWDNHGIAEDFTIFRDN